MINDFLEYLKKNKSSLVNEWVAKVVEINPACHQIYDESVGLSSKIFDSFCNLLESNDFEPMKSLLGHMKKGHKFSKMTFLENQQWFGSFRYILLPTLIKRYRDEDLLTILSRVNHVIDMIIFYFSDHYQKDYERSFKAYTKQLEKEVKRQTLELNESRSNYQILFEEISDGCFVNQGGRIVFANKVFCEMHGYSHKDLIGTKCKKLIADDSRDSVMKRFYQHLKDIVPSEVYIYCRQDKSGHHLPTENRVKLIRYNGKPAVLGLCTDITKRLEMEQKIKQKDRLSLIGRLSTSIAHEIRNPLSAIKVNIQLLMTKLKLEGYDRRRLEIAFEQSIQLENIVSQMMDFASPLKLNYSMTSIYELIDHAIEIFEERIKNENIDLTKNLDKGLPGIMIDKEKMLEAVTNVLVNALEAFNGPNGHKKIDFRAKTTIYHGNKHVNLSIMDNGMGINPEDMGNIFEPFFTKKKKDGVDLGLSIVKKIVAAHKGHIKVSSEEMKNTHFNLTIPVDITQ